MEKLINYYNLNYNLWCICAVFSMKVVKKKVPSSTQLLSSSFEFNAGQTNVLEFDDVLSKKDSFIDSLGRLVHSYKYSFIGKTRSLICSFLVLLRFFFLMVVFPVVEKTLFQLELNCFHLLSAHIINYLLILNMIICTQTAFVWNIHYTLLEKCRMDIQAAIIAPLWPDLNNDFAYCTVE